MRRNTIVYGETTLAYDVCFILYMTIYCCVRFGIYNKLKYDCIRRISEEEGLLYFDSK
jgi:hypothetical protein